MSLSALELIMPHPYNDIAFGSCGFIYTNSVGTLHIIKIMICLYAYLN
ncbi:hypothetical protein SAMN05216311_12343 [Chitinophaga sp. CF418]|nr:hypothetical protein SAMN05216311_12343 [Chitinophaga sp. CF418]